MRTAIVIPARFDAKRLPGKPLLRETGKFLIQHAWEAASRVRGVDTVLIATDDERIINAAESFGARAVLTSPDARSGTDRVAEAARPLDAGCIVNVQGDEPDLDPEAVEALIRAMKEHPETPMGTLAARCDSPGGLEDSAAVKVVVDASMRALYFSRSLIPHDRDDAGTVTYYRHIGVYAYRKEFLLRFVELPTGRLEEAERLEQLRALEHGAEILVVEAERACSGIDTLEDYAAFVERFKKTGLG